MESVSNMAMIYRLFYGMKFETDGIRFLLLFLKVLQAIKE